MMKAQFVPAWQSGRAQFKAAWSRADLYRLTASVRPVTSLACSDTPAARLGVAARPLTTLTHQVSHV